MVLFICDYLHEFDMFDWGLFFSIEKLKKNCTPEKIEIWYRKREINKTKKIPVEGEFTRDENHHTLVEMKTVTV